MYEKVNKFHPDKIADRIAGALVDYAYSKENDPKIAVEVLIGHGVCHIIAETSIFIPEWFAADTVKRIAGDMDVVFEQYPQDAHLADNQAEEIRCGDNGIFKGTPVTDEQKKLTEIAMDICDAYGTDGKYILDGDKLIICQSHADGELNEKYPDAIVNPLGFWTGGPNTDSGATNRKLGSDMGDSVTGGGLCLSGDSEYFGEDFKWHRMDEYDGGKVAQWNDGRMEFVEPLRYIANENDKLLHIYNQTKLSMCLTPYHEMLIETSKGNLIKKPAGEIAEKLEQGIGNAGSILHSFLYDTSTRKSKFGSENEYRLQVAICADGTLLPENNTHNCRIRVKKEYKKERLRELLKGTSYKESIENNGEFSIFWVKAPVWSKSLYRCFKDEPLDILRDEVLRWDGDIENGIFRTTKKEDADFVQFAFAADGKVATITYADRIGREKGEYVEQSICYNVNILKSNVTHLRKTKETPIFVDSYENSNSYCFEVPSHNLIIRHNDRIFITGNCGKDLSKADVSVNIYCWLKAQETGEPVEMTCAIGDTEVNGIPYSEIVEVARNYIDEVGGFEKFAEWGLIR